MDSAMTIVGNVTREPELRFTGSGAAWATLSVAVNRRWQNKTTQEWEEQVSFIDVKVWGTLAENVSTSLDKGSRIIASGRVEQENWETDGQKRSKLVLVADSIGPDLRWATCEIAKTERTGTSSTSPPKKAAPKPVVEEDPF